MHCKTIIVFITTLVVGSYGFGIGGGFMSYGSRGFFPRGPQRTMVSGVSRGGPVGGVMYFRDPSPSHLRYPKDSYKTRMEEKQKEKDLTRWDWINDMSQQYQNPQHEIEQNDEEENEVMNPQAMTVKAKQPEGPTVAEADVIDKDAEAEMIVSGLLRRIQELNSRKRDSRYQSALVGPRPPLLLMG